MVPELRSAYAPKPEKPATPVGTSCLLTVAGERWRCPDCGSNMFTLIERPQRRCGPDFLNW